MFSSVNGMCPAYRATLLMNTMKGSIASATVQHFVERLGKSLGHDHKSTLVNPRGTSRLLLKVLT